MSWPLAIFHDGLSRFFVFDHVNGVIVFNSKDGQLTHQRTWGTYNTASILRLGSDLVLVQAKVIKRVKSSQVGPHGRREAEEDAGVIVLNATTGQLLTRAPGAPLIGTATGNVAVTYQQDPFPRVALVPWRETRRQAR